MTGDEREDDTIYEVVVNHEEQYSIWPADLEPVAGWRATWASAGRRRSAWLTSTKGGRTCAPQPARQMDGAPSGTPSPLRRLRQTRRRGMRGGDRHAVRHASATVATALAPPALPQSAP